MIKKSLLFLCFILLTISSFSQNLNQDFIAYVEKYKDIAIREMERAGIPASIKLGQALLESDAGKSDLARRGNNHFGIKCSKDWDGKTFYKKDDEYDDKGKLIESCFRVYKDVESSFVAHSEFLRDPSKVWRYGFLFRLDPTDYKRWAKGLREAGYATSGTYDTKLIELIEKYELNKYDRMTSSDLVVSVETTTGYLVNNDVKYVLAAENEPVSEIARKTDTTVRSLLKYNENLSNGSQQLPQNTKVYIQPKRSSYRGKQNWHYVKAGETMQYISDLYAVKLSKLLSRNRMRDDDEPAANERIKLRGTKVAARPRLQNEAAPEILPQIPEVLFEEEEIIPTAPKPSTPTVEKPVSNPPVDSVQTKPVEKPTTDANKPRQNNVPEKPTPPAAIEKPVVIPTPPRVDSTGINKPLPDEGFDATFDQPKPNTSETPVFHTIVKGDTLWNISKRYNTTVDALKKLNNLTSDNIQLGMKLRVE